jgi:hypothetical protein
MNGIIRGARILGKAPGGETPTGVPVPALCAECGRLFPSALFLGAGVVIDVKSTTVAACPFCGGGASIPDGIYESLGDAIKILSGGEATLAALRRLQEILQKAQNDNANPEAVAEEIKAKVPTLAKIAAFIQKYPFSLLVALISVVLSRFPATPKRPPPNITNNVTNNITNTIIHETFARVNADAQAKLPKQVPIRRSEKIGRNDPCSCGSGKKFKKCHGAAR